MSEQRFKDSFEEYLRNIFANSYTGTDDLMPDAECDWFNDLDPADVIVWAEKWGQEMLKSEIRKERAEIISLIDSYWKFNNQFHASSWHDKQDLVELLRVSQRQWLNNGEESNDQRD